MIARLSRLVAVLALSVGGCGGGPGGDGGGQEAACRRFADAACDRLTTCFTTIDLAACRDEQLDTCCGPQGCDGDSAASETSLASCENALGTASCELLEEGRLPDACADVVEPPPVEVSMRWEFYAGNTLIDCDDYYATTTMEFVVTDAQGAQTEIVLPCGPGAGTFELAAGSYQIDAIAVDDTGPVETLAGETLVVEPAEPPTMVWVFDVFTSFGGYCQGIGQTFCETCSDDPDCVDDFVYACCDEDGYCGRPATAPFAGLDACIAALEQQAACGDFPDACSGFIDVF